MTGQEKSPDALITVAHGVRPRGLKGEILAELLTDFPERFKSIGRLWAVGPGGERKPLILEGYWFQKARVVLKFAEYDTVETAQTLIGYDFSIPEDERVKLSPGEFYNWELEGCLVETVEGKKIGHVQEVRATGGVGILVVRSKNQSEYLIPLAESIAVNIDVGSKRIRIDPPEGLLEL